MAQYHPIDVRYKGPSTSYRGSSAPIVASVDTGHATKVPKVSRKARNDNQLFNAPSRLVFWMFKKWGGFIAALALYFVFTGFNPLHLLTLLGSL